MQRSTDEHSAIVRNRKIVCPSCREEDLAFDVRGITVTIDSCGNVMPFNIFDDGWEFDDAVVCVCLECDHTAPLKAFAVNAGSDASSIITRTSSND